MRTEKKTIILALIMTLSLNSGCAALALGDATVAPEDAQAWRALEADLRRTAERQAKDGTFSSAQGCTLRSLAEDEKALLRLMEAEVAASKDRGGYPTPLLSIPTRPLTDLEKAMMRRLILQAAENIEAGRKSVQIRIVDAETKKPIPNALVAGEFHDASFGGRSKTRYKKYAVGADGVFSAVTDAEVFQVNAPGYDTEEVLSGGSPFGGRAVSLENLKKNPPALDIMACYFTADVTNPKAEQAAKAWRKFVLGEEVQLVKSAGKTELDVRRIKLVAKKSKGAVVVPVLGFSYRTEDRDLKQYPLSAVERCDWNTGLLQPTLLSDQRKQENQKLTRQERRLPDDLPAELIKELDELGLDVQALCRVHAVILLCETDKTGKIAMAQVGPVWKYTESYKQRSEYSTEERKLYDQEYKKRTQYREVECPRLEELERRPRPGLYPTKVRLIALGQGDGFAVKQDLQTRGYRHPSTERQMRRAPETGYQREWVLTAEDIAVAHYDSSGNSQFKAAFVRLNGKYGRVKMSGMTSLSERMEWESEAKKMEHKGWEEKRLRESSGVDEGREEVRLNLDLYMQPDGTRNLHTVAYDF